MMDPLQGKFQQNQWIGVMNDDLKMLQMMLSTLWCIEIWQNSNRNGTRDSTYRIHRLKYSLYVMRTVRARTATRHSNSVKNAESSAFCDNSRDSHGKVINDRFSHCTLFYLNWSLSSCEIAVTHRLRSTFIIFYQLLSRLLSSGDNTDPPPGWKTL